MKTTLPPQAYTRDILSQAFLWVQKQPDSIRSMATTPDALVGLYLRAKRNGDSLESEAPVSTEDFRANLKNLAHELNQFSEKPSTSALPTPPTSYQAPQPGSQQQAPHQPQPQQPALQAAYSVQQPIPPSYQPQAAPPSLGPSLESLRLDQRTMDILTRVKTVLNLSSEVEALRMLVILGHEKLQVLFRKDNSV